MVAYASDHGDEEQVHIWIQQVGGAPIRLTNGPADDTEPSFSPDGTKIVYHSDRNGGGIYTVPSFGGESRLIAAGGRRPHFSPDGSRILYWVGGDTGASYTVDLNGGSPRSLQGKFHSVRFPIWSPDGKYVLAAAYHTTKPPGDNDWWVIPVDGGEPIKTGAVPALAQQNILLPGAIGELVPSTWLPNNDLIFAGRSGDALSLWTITLSARTLQVQGPARPLSSGTSDGHPAAAADERGLRRLAFATLSRKIHLWALPLDMAKGITTGPPMLITRGGNEATQVTMSADGKRIAYLWDRDNAKPSVWVRDMDSGKLIEIPGPSGKNEAQWTPSIAPDGASVAWSVYQDGHVARTYLTELDGDKPRPPKLLCEPCGTSGWSRNGELLFYSDPSLAASAFDLRSRRSVEILHHPDGAVWGGRPSPDNRWVVFNMTSGHSESRIFAAPLDVAQPRSVPVDQWIPLTDGKQWDDKPRWAPDGRSIYFLSARDGFRCIWRQVLDPATRQPRGEATAVAHFHGARLSMMNVSMGPLSIAVGPRTLVVSLTDLNGEVWTATPQR
jgi:Tol biopolymer transport system component